MFVDHGNENSEVAHFSKIRSLWVVAHKNTTTRHRVHFCLVVHIQSMRLDRSQIF